MNLETLVIQVKARKAEAQATAAKLGPEAAPSLVRLAEDPDPEIRGMALVCLGIVGTEHASNTAMNKLTDEEDQVVAQALQVLQRHPPLGREQELLRILQDPAHAEIRSDLALIAGRLAPKIDPTPWKELWKKETDQEVKKNLLLALARMGDKEAREIFVTQMQTLAKGGEAVEQIDNCKYMEDTWIIPHMLPLLDRTETAIELAPDLPKKWPLRTCDLAGRAIIELIKVKVDFPIKGPNQFTKEQIDLIRGIAAQISIFLVGCISNEKVDNELAKKAEVVLRVKCAEIGYGSKYHWQKVEILKVIKNESNYNFKDTLSVAHYGWEEDIPLGVSTIYLEKYNPSREDLWKLVGGKFETGVSHYNKK